MNRKMNATDSKISALLRSQMMKWLEFRNLVTKLDRFFYDHKLYELMKKTHNREINVLDHKFDFYSILLELLYEVHRNDPFEQPKLLEKVLEWHRTNQDKLKLTRNEAPKGNSVAQLLECKNIQQVIQQRDEVSPKGSASDLKSSGGEVSTLQSSDHICTDENAACPSITTLKSIESNQRKKPVIPGSAARPKTSPESRTLTQQYKPLVRQRTESFRSFCERNMNLQEASLQKCLQNPSFKRKGTLNLGDVLSAANAISTQIELTREKRAQSVPPYQSRVVAKVNEKNPQRKTVPRSTTGGKVYYDWRGIVSQESSGTHSVVVVSSAPQRAWSEKKALKKRRQKQSAAQSNVQKALDFILHQKNTVGQRGTTVADVPKVKMWKIAAVESPENESLQKTDLEQADQPIGSLHPWLSLDEVQQEINRLCMEKDRKIQGVASANFPVSSIDQAQDTNILIKQKYTDSTDIYRRGSEMGGQLLCNCKKTEITKKTEIPDQSEDTSKANRGQGISHRLIYQNNDRDNKNELNKRLKIRAHFNERAMSTATTTNKDKQNNMKRDKNAACTSIYEKENILLLSHDNCTFFQSCQNDKAFKEYFPETSDNDDYLTFTSETRQYRIKTDQGQHIRFSLFKPIDLRECTTSTFDYQQTMQTIQMRVLGHCIQPMNSSKMKARKHPNLVEDIKRPVLPAYSKKTHSFQTIKPSKAGRPSALYFQPKDADAIAKASEIQKKVNAAVNIHQLFSGYTHEEYLLGFLENRSANNLEIWEKHLQWKRQHQLYRKKLMSIYDRPQNIEMKVWQKNLFKRKIQHKVDRKRKTISYQRRLQNVNAARARRLEDVIPHKELLDGFHPKRTGPSPYQKKMAATFIQKFIRGWLVRVTYNRIKTKALDHGASLSAVVRQYRDMMRRLRRRLNAPQQQISFEYSELEDWLDKKKKYEEQFARREFWKVINTNELPNFFQDCDHYPSQHVINKTWALINTGPLIKLPETLNKKQVIELAFTIYPPQGASLGDRSIYQSTWVRPIVDGEEGYKYILSDHPVLRQVKIQVIGDLVTRSIFERNQNPTSIQKRSTIFEGAINALAV